MQSIAHLAPTQRHARFLVMIAVVVTLSVWAGHANLVSQVLAVAIVLLSALDAWMLWRQPAPTASVMMTSGMAVLRRPYQLEIDVSGVRLAEVVVRVPYALGGPVLHEEGVWDGSRVVFSCVPKVRGLHSVLAVWVRQTSVLALWARRTVVPVVCKVDVLPDLLGPANQALGNSLLEVGARASLGMFAAGGELRSLRPFHSGDDPRHVDWKATARLGAPIMREWLPDRRRSVLIVLDAGRLMRAEHDGESKFDAALRGVVRLALAAEAHGDRVGMLVYADKPLRRVPPLEGAGQAGRLLRYVNDIKALPNESHLNRVVPHILEERRRALVVVVTDVLDQNGAQNLIAPVMQIARRHVPLLVLVRDPYLDQALTQPVLHADDAYRRAAAELVMRDREAAQSALKTRGVKALDVSMRGLALDVVQAYAQSRGQMH